MDLSISSGVTHLASEPGAGGTTLSLQLARGALADGRIVFWICREVPSGSRIGQILGTIDPIAVSRFQVGSFGEQISRGIKSLLPVINSLRNIGLVVVDDWADSTGRQNRELIGTVRKLMDRCGSDDIPLVICSSMYEDAGGSGWKVRGGQEILSAVDSTWKLIRDQGSRRRLLTETGEMQLSLQKDGFEEIH